MKFICDGSSLSEAVIKTSKACAVRTTAPIMECLKISALSDKIILLATDGELSIRKSLKAEVFEEGEICVPGKLFADFIGKLSEIEVTVQTGERGMEIIYGDSVSNMQTLPAEDFPAINFEVGESSFVMKSEALKRIISGTSFCCAQDDSRPILKGCLFELKDRLEVTALDGYRLALSQAEILSKTNEMNLICPARTLVEITRIIAEGQEEVTVYTQGGTLLVNAGDMTLVSRLYQGEFIRKENVIPQSFASEVILPRMELIASVERAAIVIRGDKNNLVTLEIGGNTVKITSASDLGKVEESVKGIFKGKDITISMNAKFLLEALRALEEEEVVLSLNSPVSPFILQNRDRKDSLYLILPVKNAS